MIQQDDNVEASPMGHGAGPVAVVGAGVVGCAVAWQLARAGLAVTLIERDAIAAHASGINAGNLNPLHGTPPALVPFALDSFHLHFNIRAELAALGCWRDCAVPVERIFLGCDPSDRGPLDAIASRFANTSGFSAVWLDQERLHQLEPRLSFGFHFGVLASGNLTVDGSRLTHALAAGAARLGCIHCRGEVIGMETRGDRVTGLRTSAGMVDCHSVVLSTGPWTAAPGAWLGIDIPVEPVKGEMLRVRLPGGPPRYDLSWNQTSVYRRADGEVWIGTTLTRSAMDATPSVRARETLLVDATRMLPDMRHALLLEHRAALRPMSVSGEPIAARAGGWQNVYIANGGGSKGLLLSAGIARAVCDLLLEESRNPPPEKSDYPAGAFRATSVY